jgi:hypothetical protein
MSTLEKLEAEITKLPDDEFAKLREWFDEYAANMWDRQIERDAKAGKLVKLAERALQHEQAGRTTKPYGHSRFLG